VKRPILLLAAALVGLAPGLRGAGPAPAPPLQFKVTLTRPMLAASGYLRLEPGDYAVAIEPSAAGLPHAVAVFSRGGLRVAAVPAELKGAPAGTKLSDIEMGTWTQATLKPNDDYKNGKIVQLHLEVKVRSEKAFYEALLAEVGMPEGDASSKAPVTVDLKAPRSLPSIVPPAPTPAKK
jgi:hypothetical protein